MHQAKSSRDIYHLSEFYQEKSAGRYAIPKINKELFIPSRIIDFSQALSSKDYESGVHFYLDDSRFERIWKAPKRYLPVLKRFSCVFSPDFSLYQDMPLAIKIWNVYRSRLLAQMMQRAGIRVIPTISWASKDTFSFCFSGIERGSIVTISTLGVFKTQKTKSVFQEGCKKMCSVIRPKAILLYGKLPDYDFGEIEIKQYPYSRYHWKKQTKRLY